MQIIIMGLGLSVLSVAFILSDPLFKAFSLAPARPVPRELEKRKTIRDHVWYFAAGDSGEKTEKATPKKKEDAKKKGQLPRSTDVVTALMLVGTFGVMAAFGKTCLTQLANFLQLTLQSTLIHHQLDLAGLTTHLAGLAVMVFGLILLPIAGMAMLGNVGQNGFNWTPEALKPSLQALNPINGAKELVAMKQWFELLKNLIKLAIIVSVAVNQLMQQQGRVFVLFQLPLIQAMMVSGEIFIAVLQAILVVFVLIAVVDLAFQRFDYARKLRMSKQEQKEEYKQMEGNPVFKRNLRQRQAKMRKGNLLERIPAATVVVTNPTHYAIALRYEEGDHAPVVVAKGIDHLAQRIKALAAEHQVPMVENRPLARTLYSTVDVDQEIPVELYVAVSQILRSILILDQEKSGRPASTQTVKGGELDE